jgi:hypothetical protein
MAKKILVPVFPSDRFYEAVVRAGDIIADEDGLIVFLFTRIRPTPESYAAEGDGRPAELDVSTDAGGFDAADLERWREQQIGGLQDARNLLFERGVDDRQVDYLFADEADAEGAAQAIADEAAAGAYDLVILARGYFINEVNAEDSSAEEVAAAVQALDGPRLVVA